MNSMDKDIIVTLYLGSKDSLAIFSLKLLPMVPDFFEELEKIVFLQIKNVNILPHPHFMFRFLHRKVSWDLLGGTLCRSQPKVKFQW